MEPSIETKAEKSPPDKEGLCYAIGRVLGEGYVLTAADIREIGAIHYNLSSASISTLFSTRRTNQIMDELKVDPMRKDYKGKKVYKDRSRKTVPGELEKTYRRIDEKIRKASQARFAHKRAED